jgi:hypothetical protein
VTTADSGICSWLVIVVFGVGGLSHNFPLILYCSGRVAASRSWSYETLTIFRAVSNALRLVDSTTCTNQSTDCWEANAWLVGLPLCNGLYIRAEADSQLMKPPPFLWLALSGLYYV